MTCDKGFEICVKCKMTAINASDECQRCKKGIRYAKQASGCTILFPIEGERRWIYILLQVMHVHIVPSPYVNDSQGFLLAVKPSKPWGNLCPVSCLDLFGTNRHHLTFVKRPAANRKAAFGRLLREFPTQHSILARSMRLLFARRIENLRVRPG